MAEVYVSVGSNVEPEREVSSCLRALRERFGPLRVSTIYRSKAVGFVGADFLNLVVQFDTAEAVRQVVSLCTRLRRLMADTATVRNFPTVRWTWTCCCTTIWYWPNPACTFPVRKLPATPSCCGRWRN